ncbi:MAG TPA: hypothetical protein VFX92_02575 [Candidatus Krumholzibacteria bacterium]|nr:hypothetical protein [Candidatus Krumholzibacteria bacterium]
MERARTLSIREFILDAAAADPRSLARRVATAYGISRQAANRHLDLLVESGHLEQSGKTRARVYRLRRTSSLTRELRVTPVLNPDRVWEDHVAPVLSADGAAVRDLCRGAFGELVRNAAEHAGASWITFSFSNNARDIDVTVSDDGAGFFTRMAGALGASTPRGAADRFAELSNARATDSPGARLALLGRNFHTFQIWSGPAQLRFDREADHWSAADAAEPRPGTTVAFRLRRGAAAASRATRAEATVGAR